MDGVTFNANPYFTRSVVGIYVRSSSLTPGRRARILIPASRQNQNITIHIPHLHRGARGGVIDANAEENNGNVIEGWMFRQAGSRPRMGMLMLVEMLTPERLKFRSVPRSSHSGLCS